MKRFYFLLLCGFCVFSRMESQEINSRNTEWMNYLEEMGEQEEVDEASLELLYEDLSHLSENSLNVNTVSKTDLERLPFLSDKSIEDLLYYIYKYGPIPELSELKNVENIDRQTLTYMLPFLYAGEIEKKESFLWKNLIKQAKQEILIRSDYTLQEKAGYRKTEEGKEKDPGNYYLGEPYNLFLRYEYRFRNKIQFGIATEKDAGEKFWRKGSGGFDHYAINMNIKDIGILKNLHLGDYRLSFGEGLVMNTQFSMGKSTDVINLGQKNTGIKRHVSSNENNYFRGIAAGFKWKEVDISIFGSYRKHDANSDSRFIYSFKTDGYNRTSKDLEKKNSALIESLGGNFQWGNERVSLGISSIFYSFGGKTLDPEPQPYNLYYLRGKRHANLGIHYLYQERYFIIKGEAAIDKNQKIAYLNHLIIQPNNQVNLSLSVRHYAKDYKAFFGKGFGETSSVQNESGIYAGIRIRPAWQWEINSYIDFFRSDWLRYGINSPSSGKDFLLGITFRPRSSSSLNFRYKYKEKVKNQILEDGRNTFVLPYRQHRFRQQFQYSNENKFNARSQADYTIYEDANGIRTGWSLSQIVSIIPIKDRIQWDLGLIYFHTADWNTRISGYEKNILYAFSFPNYYGEGFRCYSVFKWKIVKSLTLYLKISNSHYFNRIFIGSGLEEIEGYNKSDVFALMKFTF